MKAYHDAAGLASAGVAGALLGRGVILRAGWKAAGMMGGGSGIGAKALPVGMTFGAMLGLSAYGLGRTAREVYREATAPRPVERRKPVQIEIDEDEE